MIPAFRILLIITMHLVLTAILPFISEITGVNSLPKLSVILMWHQCLVFILNIYFNTHR